jgi:F-type H+-transporting ATPase subunit b
MLKIPPDQTFLIQIVLFVALWLVLKRWWFEPALRVLRERTARSEGAIREAQAVQAEVERLRREHAAALEVAKAEAQREVQDMIRAAETEHKRVVSEASAEANRTLTEARAQIAEQVAAARRDLRGQVQDIAREVTRKVLGRAV